MSDDDKRQFEFEPGVNYRWNGERYERIPEDTVAVKFDSRTGEVSYLDAAAFLKEETHE
jgi:hypothetical protein